MNAQSCQLDWLVYLVQVRLGTEVLRTQSSTLGTEVLVVPQSHTDTV